MAYNNMFPMGYQPMNYAQPQCNNQFNQQTQNSSSLIWVQGIEGAKSYLVAPNTTVQLWDSESQTIYLKSADASGMPSMKVLDYTIRQNAPQSPQSAVSVESGTNPYAEDIKALQGQIDALRDELRTLKKTAGVKEKKKDE